MKTTNMITVAILSAVMASPSVAQVAASFDNLVDDAFVGIDTTFFSGAVNSATIDGSIVLNGGAALQGGSLATASNGSLTESVNVAANEAANAAANEAADIAVNINAAGLPGGLVIAGDAAASAASSSASSSAFSAAASSVSTEAESATLIVGAVQQNFGEVSTVAAGAINDSQVNLTQTGSLAASAVNSSAGSAAFAGSASNTTGTAFSAVQGAFNSASIIGTIDVNMANASGGATSVGTVAAGAINAGGISATFIGGSAAETSVSGN